MLTCRKGLDPTRLLKSVKPIEPSLLMKLRCELHLGQDVSRVILVPRPEEKLDHLALKLAAFAMFHALGPIVDPSVSHPSLSDFDLKPDLLVINEGGEIKLWIECGVASLNKLDKAARRLPGARVVVIQSTLHEAKQLRVRLQDETKHADRIEIWTWPGTTFTPWMKALQEKNELFGEAHEKSLNLVVNDIPYTVDLISA